ncbi:hypothetical protein KJ359_003938 [Pestalotiopsis sp. 9143b]|nr:hypothetical protein KJ359_003938 [Pestalotiopsis sp. 9143b]
MATMRAWQYTTIDVLESSLRLVTDLPKPSAETLRQDQVLIKTLYASLNPADRKVANLGIYTKLRVGLPATPGQKRQQVWDALPLLRTKPSRHSSKSGQRVFINGGSGGVGIFAIQFVKILGAEVTVTCSTRNVQLCQELGADTIDYTQINVLDALQQGAKLFDHVVDNVGNAPELYQSAPLYTHLHAKYIQVGGDDISAMEMARVARNLFLPSFPGGVKREFRLSIPGVKTEELALFQDWVAQGKVKIVVDEQFSFENAVQAFEKVKTGRARGQILVSVS